MQRYAALLMVLGRSREKTLIWSIFLQLEDTFEFATCKFYWTIGEISTDSFKFLPQPDGSDVIYRIYEKVYISPPQEKLLASRTSPFYINACEGTFDND